MINYEKRYNCKQLAKMYLQEGKSMEEIGRLSGGITRQSVANRIAKCGIEKVRSVKVACGCNCGTSFVVMKSRFLRSQKHFLNRAHYFEYLRKKA